MMDKISKKCIEYLGTIQQMSISIYGLKYTSDSTFSLQTWLLFALPYFVSTIKSVHGCVWKNTNRFAILHQNIL